jgi:hypothetical protein
MRPTTFNALRFTLLGLLILWGGYSLLAYLGVPVHMTVLLTGEDKAAIDAVCEPGRLFCAGWRALMPSIIHTIGRSAPFAGYVVVSMLAIGGLYAWRLMNDGEFGVSFRLSPWKLLLAFTASLWLLFTMLSYGTTSGQPTRRLYEPLPQVYVGAGPEALRELGDNFNTLKDRGCLTYLGQTNHDAGVYDMKGGCMQMSFVTRVLPFVAFVVFLLYAFATLGRLLLSLADMRPRDPLLELVFSAGIGAGGLIVLLWLLALASLYTPTAGWVLFIVVFGFGWRHAVYWARRFINAEWTVETSWKSGVVLLTWLLISYLALNFLNVVRPFPIGWDDLGRYINQPKLLVSYGHFIPSMSTFQWEYITSLGFLLFGYDNIFGATAAMMINWMAGLMAVAVMYAAGATFMGRGRGVLTALVYYTLPLVGHFSFADMKVDNAVFTMGSLGVLALMLAIFPTASDENESDEEGWPVGRSLGEGRRWLILAGIFGGLAFSFKPTSIMMITSSIAMLLGVVHWTGFAGGFFLTWVLYGAQGQLKTAEIFSRIGLSPDFIGTWTIVGVCFVVGAGALAYAASVRRVALLRSLKGAGLIAVTLLATIAPWLAYNNIQYGNVIPRIALTAPNDISPTIHLSKDRPTDYGQTIRTLPPDLALDTNNPACVSTSKAEELDRYWGYGTGWSHYLTLPWRTVMNLDSAGYYVTLVPILLLFPLILLLPYAWTRRGRWVLWLAAATLFALLQWMLFANGIPWYGLSVFFGLCLGMELLVAKSPDIGTKITASVLVALSLLIAFAMRFWQFEQQGNLLEYPIGKVTAEAMRERTIPHYDDIRETALQRFESLPDRPYVYRVGTFIPYFIPRNLEVLPLADHQLDTFNCLYQERDAAKTLKRLQALGFNSIIFDTNTHTIERDPQGSLHKKVERFVEFINSTSLGLRIVVNDPGNGIAYILLP